MYDKIESNGRALNGESIEQSHFGPLLIPIEKLPTTVQLHISRKLGKENWDIEEFLKCINDEVTARENCEFMKVCENETFREERKYTSSSLFVKSREIRCVFCDTNSKHYSDKCEIITDVNAHFEKIKNTNLYFNCLVLIVWVQIMGKETARKRYDVIFVKGTTILLCVCEKTTSKKNIC